MPANWQLVAVGDFNGDGHPDYALYNTSTFQTAIWYLNNNVFVSGAYGPTLPANWQLVAVADFNGDGHPDYALYNTSTFQTAIWYLNNNVLVGSAYGAGNAWHWYFLQQDHEGSVTHLTDTSGNVIEKYRYDAFGAPTFYNSSTAYNNRFLFTGREYAATYRGTYVSTFSFYEYRARAYNPTLGRFMSEDPKLFDAGDYHLFRYCHNDPIDFTDPMGTQDAHVDPWPTHAQQAQALDRLAATRELLGLSSTYIRAALSAMQGQMERNSAMGEGSQSGQAAQHSRQSFSTSVTTVINPPDAQSGIKSVQALTINTDGTWSAQPPYAGHTDIGRLQFDGTYRTFESVKGIYPVFTAKMNGHFTSAMLPERMSIDYKFKVGVNFQTHQAWVTGRHDGYPSYIIRGGGQSLYQWSQRSIWNLQPRMEVPVSTSPVSW